MCKDVYMHVLITHSLQAATSSIDLIREPLWSTSVTLISMAGLLVGQGHQIVSWQPGPVWVNLIGEGLSHHLYLVFPVLAGPGVVAPFLPLSTQQKQLTSLTQPLQDAKRVALTQTL